jgi:hypothetical protein
MVVSRPEPEVGKVNRLAAKRPLNAHVLDGPCGLLAIAVSFAAGFVKTRALYKVRHI